VKRWNGLPSESKVGTGCVLDPGAFPALLAAQGMGYDWHRISWNDKRPPRRAAGAQIFLSI
jgi:hypothetical protein